MKRHHLLLSATLFALPLPGCRTAPDSAEPAQQEQADAGAPAEQAPSATPRDIAFADAQRRLNAAEDRLIAAHVAIKRFLMETPLEDLRARSIEIDLNARRIIIEKHELEKKLDKLQATHAALTAARKQGNYKPTPEELRLIESGTKVQAYDSQLEQLQAARAKQAEKLGGKEALAAIDKQIETVKAEREKAIAKQTDTLLSAKIEQAGIGVQVVSEELKKASKSLDKWTAKRREIIDLLNEYETLLRVLEAAELERDLLVNLIDDLLEPPRR